MNRFCNYLIAGCLLSVQQASAQQPSIPRMPDSVFPQVNVNIEKSLKLAEKHLKDAEIRLKDLEINKKTLAAINREHFNSLKNKAESDSKRVSQSPSAASEKQKQITKSYKVSSNDKLSIQNQFGRVSVNTWSKNEIKVDIVVKAFDPSDQTAQRLLDDVSIEESKQGNLITFKTNINKGRSAGWWDAFRRKAGGDEKRGVEVFYTVYMPSENPLDITNSYGSVLLPDLKGQVNLSTSYSSLTSKTLKNKQNQLTMKYGSANIEAFSGRLNLSYGSLKLTSAENLNATISYGNATIDKLTESADFNIKYTSKFTINEVGKNTDHLDINAAYSGIVLGLDQSAKYNYDVTVSFGGFKYNSQLTAPTISPVGEGKHFNPTKNYKGIYGSGGTASRITIRSNYGSVRFQ